jgi:hypothetical protein
VHKTTLYLPEDLKRGVEVVSQALGVSEAEVIRDAIRRRVQPSRPKPGIFSDPEFDARQADAYLDGFGER